MTTLLVRNAYVATMDDERRELPEGALFVRDGLLETVGPAKEAPRLADQILDLSGYVVLPGLINTHHHFYQTLTRAVRPAQDANLFNWLKTLYPIWARLTPEDIRVSTQTALAELALSGCTTAFDHLYLYPNGATLDDEIAAAREVGVRLHASRGSMSLGESAGGLPPDQLVESDESILRDSRRVIEAYHDKNRGSNTQIALAPCSPFSVTPELMRESAALARGYGVRLHTHLAETEDEEEFCLQKVGRRPVDYMEHLGWVGPDVWFAHAVYVRDSEIDIFARHGCGVAHCPTSNMRLASGIAPVREYRAAGVKVGLGVDGSASNDGSHMLAEVRQALLLARVRDGITGFSLSADPGRQLLTARDALWLATRGGASVLGRDDIGSLEPGKCADFFAVNLNRPEYAGALSDPVSALVLCQAASVDYTVVGGRIIVERGRLTTVELGRLIESHNQAARRLLAG